MKVYSLLIVSLFWAFHIFAQRQDFNEYRTLTSVGEIPADFSTRTYDKITEDLEKGREEITNKKGEKIFIQSVNSSIDEILHSGLVIYGDEVSIYVEEVARKVLASQPELAKRLRFYTLKSNVANALSTDQGIVFVTTGLIAQLENEAQLAFVIAHEISHFTENHVVQGFEYNYSNRYQLNIEKLSVYSKDKEFEADLLGVKLYHDAGYSMNEVISGFDVLLYSYLPFDEVEFPLDYFNSDLYYVPENQFPSKKYEIKAAEDIDDSKSSHPNIKSRKIKVKEQMNAFSDWGDVTFHFGKERFEYIRTICRFESIRTDIIDYQYADALYTIFLLEKEFPESIYLQRRKAQIWLSVSQLQNAGYESKYVDRSTDYEGEIASIHFFLKKLNKSSTAALAMRQIQDIYLEYPEDTEIMEIRRRMIRSLAYNENFKLEEYSTKSFQTANTEFLDEQANDSIVETLEIDEEKLSKYDKIRKKKDINNKSNFDSTYYYKYGLSDLMADESFKEEYKIYESEKEKKKQEKDAYYALSNKEQKKFNEEKADNENKIGLKSGIMFDPYASHYNRRGGVDPEKSEKLRENFMVATQNTIDNVGLDLKPVARYNLNEIGTQGFNDRALILTYFHQNEYLDEIDDIFPVDYKEMEDLQKRYGTSNLIFSVIEHEFYFSDGYPYGFLISLIPPLTFIYFPLKFMSMHHTELSFVVFNLQDPSKSKAAYYYFRESPSRLSIESRLYEIYSNFSLTPETH